MTGLVLKEETGHLGCELAEKTRSEAGAGTMRAASPGPGRCPSAGTPGSGKVSAWGTQHVHPNRTRCPGRPVRRLWDGSWSPLGRVDSGHDQLGDYE